MFGNQGALVGEILRPDAYRAETKRNGSDRYYGLRYLSAGTVIDRSAPRSAEGSHLDVVQVHGTVDPLTAHSLLERQLARRGFCRLVIPVFNGSELYRLHFSDDRDETLSADNYQGFVGPTRVCEVVREMIVANADKARAPTSTERFGARVVVAAPSNDPGTDGRRYGFRWRGELSCRADCTRHPPAPYGRARTVGFCSSSRTGLSSLAGKHRRDRNHRRGPHRGMVRNDMTMAAAIHPLLLSSFYRSAVSA
jgi:hypothetical protein